MKKLSLFWLMPLLALLVLIALVLGINAFAQEEEESLSLTVSPPLFELSANPGDTKTETIRLSNTSNVPQRVSVSIRNFTAQGETGGVNLTEDETSYSLASWITVDKQSATIPANNNVVFSFDINVPLNAEPGGHFGSILFVNIPDVDPDFTGATVAREIGSLMLVKVAGDIEESGQLASFETDENFYWNLKSRESDGESDVIFETRIENTGNVHFKPKGTISIKNMFGREVASIELNQNNVLPSSIRNIMTEWDPGFIAGRYTAELSAVYGDEAQIVTGSTSFFVFPYKILLPLFAIIMLVLFALIRYRKRFGEAFKALRGK